MGGQSEEREVVSAPSFSILKIVFNTKGVNNILVFI